MTRRARHPPEAALALKQQAERRGRRGEALAALWLQLKGYRVLARRVRTPAGEIDLVARRGGTLAMVEVKARARVADGLDAASPAARRRIARAAQLWLDARPALHPLDLRYDLIVVARRARLVHERDAWRPDDGAAARP